MFNPFVMFSPSFLLSFSSTLGIVTVGVRLSYFLQTKVPMRHPLQHLAAKLCATFAVSVAASAFTLPMQLIFFSEVSLNSLLSNLLAVWAVPWAEPNSSTFYRIAHFAAKCHHFRQRNLAGERGRNRPCYQINFI